MVCVRNCFSNTSLSINVGENRKQDTVVGLPCLFYYECVKIWYSV